MQRGADANTDLLCLRQDPLFAWSKFSKFRKREESVCCKHRRQNLFLTFCLFEVNRLCHYLVWQKGHQWAGCCLMVCHTSFSSSPELSAGMGEQFSKNRQTTEVTMLMCNAAGVVCTLYFMMLDLSRFTSSWSWLKRSCKYLQKGRTHQTLVQTEL